jgi:hypothetical protein
VTCLVGFIRGDYVRCDQRDAMLSLEPRENWRNLKSVVQIIKTQERR